jgi:hypothetical protein
MVCSKYAVVICDGKKVDPMIGAEFAHLKVMGAGPKTDRGAKQYVCACRCGQWTTVRSDNLRAGRVKSCGCVKKRRTMPSASREGKEFVEEIRANFYWSKPSGGYQYGFVMVKDIVGNRVAGKVGGFGYYLTTAAARPTTTGKVNTIEPILMERLWEMGIIGPQGVRTMKAWRHDEGVLFRKHMSGDPYFLGKEHAKLTLGETDECN